MGMSGRDSVSRRTIEDEYLLNIPKRYHRYYRLARTGRSRAAATRCFCLECMGWSSSEVRKCTAPGCPLYPYRLRGVSKAPREISQEVRGNALSTPESTRVPKEVSTHAGV